MEENEKIMNEKLDQIQAEVTEVHKKLSLFLNMIEEIKKPQPFKWQTDGEIMFRDKLEKIKNKENKE